MPRRRKNRALTKSEIEALTKVGTPMFLIFIEIVVAVSLYISLRISDGIISILYVFAVSILIIVTPIALIIAHNKDIEKKSKAIQIANIDSMTGVEFEQYLQQLLNNRGYNVRVTKASGDLGVDLVASRNGEKIAIQVKRHTGRVSRRAVSDSVAGMYHYGCNKAMVITNNYFSPGAISLAHSTGCILIDRDTLAKWVIEFQNTDFRIDQLPKEVQ